MRYERNSVERRERVFARKRSGIKGILTWCQRWCSGLREGGGDMREKKRGREKNEYERVEI